VLALSRAGDPATEEILSFVREHVPRCDPARSRSARVR